jgi:hypothetical protein
MSIVCGLFCGLIVGPTLRGSSGSFSNPSGGAALGGIDLKLDERTSPSTQIAATMTPFGDGQRIRFVTSPSSSQPL